MSITSRVPTGILPLACASCGMVSHNTMPTISVFLIALSLFIVNLILWMNNISASKINNKAIKSLQNVIILLYILFFFHSFGQIKGYNG